MQASFACHVRHIHQAALRAGLSISTSKKQGLCDLRLLDTAFCSAVEGNQQSIMRLIAAMAKNEEWHLIAVFAFEARDAHDKSPYCDEA